MIRKLHLKEAESDYIKIGNMVLPKNASSFGYDSYDSIARSAKRSYDAEKEAERKEEEQRLKREKGSALYQKFLDAMESSSDLMKQLEAVDDVLVPASGEADSMAGEIIRAIQRLLYRDYNDGDIFWVDYGLETCASSASFLMDYTDEHINDILNIAMNKDIEGTEYTKMLTSVAKRILFFLKKNPELFGEPPVADSRNYEGDTWDEIMDAGHSYEFEINTSEFERYGIDDYDISDFIDGVASNYPSATVSQPYRDYYVISDLTKEDYNDLDRNYWRWEEEFIEENAVEEEEEEDYDEDEDFEESCKSHKRTNRKRHK